MKTLNSEASSKGKGNNGQGLLSGFSPPRAVRLDYLGLRCEVTREDIDAMLDAYDSGMSDWTTANAISRAVARLVGLDASQRLVRLNRRTAGEEGATLVIDGVIELRVPGEAVKKLWSAETGCPTEAFEFLLELPEKPARKFRYAAEGFVHASPVRSQFMPGIPAWLS